jgi:hypothetical protein
VTGAVSAPRHVADANRSAPGSVNVNERLEVIHGMPLSPTEMVAALRRYNAIPASVSNVLINRRSFARGRTERVRAGGAGRPGREVGQELTGLGCRAICRRLGRQAIRPMRRTDPAWEHQARGWIEELREQELAVGGT